MSKGTPSFGKKSGKKSHITCRRCGRHTYSLSRRACSSCGFGKAKKLKKFSWQWKKVLGKRERKK